MMTSKKRILSISVVQTGVVVGGLYALISLIFSVFLILFGVIAMIAGSASNEAAAAMGGGLGMIIIAVILPIAYGIMGFIAGLILALVYNLIAKFTGGIEMTVVDVI
ncbi:hypothetical protein [Luteolibacter sp. AS25]|uniref:hypothetical protein n=1 Tax=Luteolibacter sp. AS25 TaxID=3135776 RepID=UPI00398AF340